MRIAFATLVSKQWHTYVSTALVGCGEALNDAQSVKARFIAGMYARACYSMLLVSNSGPKSLRLALRTAALLPQRRGLIIRLGSALLMRLDSLLAPAVHRRLLLTSELMGRLDVVLDGIATSGHSAVLRVYSLITRNRPTTLLPGERSIAILAEAARHNESAWQSEYWKAVLEPAVREYCLAEALAVTQVLDPTGMGHRSAGIDAAIKGMWYVVGPCLGLQGKFSRFQRSEWNREQQWMADTSLLMQMIDDWVDQDEDRGARMTPVLAGDWNAQSVYRLYRKTVEDLAAMLAENRIHSPILQNIFIDLYTDYLHTALAAMRNGVAA
jgi:hypothetical protein